ncbi:amidohydrolase family protein [Firmicutes bacterium CAG:170]|nr:amidohydrolase family protein [Firmicutes bacterium CAG:170]
MEALREMLTVARALRTPVHISHLKSIGKAYWGRYMPEMLALLTRAREDGLDVSCDLYPYTAGSTQLIHVLPPEAQEGGLDTLTQKLRVPEFRAAMRERMRTGTDFENLSLLVGWENIDVSTVTREENRRFVGRSVAEISAAEGVDPFDFTFDLLASESCAVTMIDRITANEDICAALRAPFSSVISDATYPTSGLLHPRVYGNCAHLLEEYVRRQGVLTLEQAVERLTSRPASVLGLAGKGRLAVGMDADLCLFDPARIHETASYAAPERCAEGMDYVFVGGVPVIAEGQFTDAVNGSVLRS